MEQIKNPVLPGFNADPSIIRVMTRIILQILHLSGSRGSPARVQRYGSLETAAIGIVNNDTA